MVKLTFIADTHHYSKSLGTTGRAYELRSGSDQKCLAETGEILDSAFEKIASSDTDYVLIAGDVSNDGEIVSHEEFREKLYNLQKSKKVYLITATHDWCNDLNPRRYDGADTYNDVPIMNARMLPEFYHDFGISDAISVFKTHIGTCSYSVMLGDKVRLLALNDDKNEHNHAGFTPEHFEWIENQIKEAQENGELVIGMEHHLLIPHINPLITGGSTCVANREYVASRLADAGLKYMFVGHSHLQHTADFKSAKGNVLTEVNIGSLVGYPAPMVRVEIDDDFNVSYKVEHLESFKLDGKEVDAQEYLKKHATALVDRVLEVEDRDEFGVRLTALQLNGEKLKKYYKYVSPILKLIKDGTVQELYTKLRHMGVARGIDKALIEKFEDAKVIDFVHQVMLSAFDGAYKSFDRNDDYYKLVMAFVEIPSKIAKKNTNFKKLIFTIDEILTGGKINNQQAII